MENNKVLKISNEKFKKALEKSGYNQTSFCRVFSEVSGNSIANDSVSHWLAGRNIPLKHLDGICKVLKVKPNELLESESFDTNENNLSLLSGKHKIVSDRVGRLLALSNMNQNELATRIAGITQKNLSATTISLWLTGNRSIPIKYLSPLCEIFGVSEPYLLGLSDGYNDSYENVKEKKEEEITLYEIDPWQLYAYDGQPIFVVFKHFEHENEWALYNRNKRVFVFCNEVIKEANLKTAEVQFYTKDITKLVDPLVQRKSLDYASFMNSDKVYIEMNTANLSIQSLYNGWYKHNENHTALINSQGLVLPYDGFKKAYLAYTYLSQKRNGKEI